MHTAVTFCTACLRDNLDPWQDTDEGYTHCCNKRLGYDLDEFIDLARRDLAYMKECGTPAAEYNARRAELNAVINRAKAAR